MPKTEHEPVVTQTSDLTNVTGTLATGDGGTGSSSTTYCGLTVNVSGTLPIANGGTNQTTTGLAFGGKVVAYSGTGSQLTAAHGLGRTPIFVAIGTTGTNQHVCHYWMVGMTAGRDNTFAGQQTTDGIIGVDGTNITIGTSGNINVSGHGYVIFVI